MDDPQLLYIEQQHMVNGTLVHKAIRYNNL